MMIIDILKDEINKYLKNSKKGNQKWEKINTSLKEYKENSIS